MEPHSKIRTNAINQCLIETEDGKHVATAIDQSTASKLVARNNALVDSGSCPVLEPVQLRDLYKVMTQGDLEEVKAAAEDLKARYKTFSWIHE
jgi:hypothetical protein